MANLLYLVHRLPYPPNKGDKVRSYHLLKHLLANHRVFLGTFVDDPADVQHIDTLRAMCAGLHVARLQPRLAKLRSLRGLFDGEALTLRYYRDTGLADWVARTVRENGIRTAVVFSSSMAQYVEHLPDMRMLVDFVDVDSAKWSDYALAHRGALSWLYRREGTRLLAYERQVAARADASFFVTESETALFRSLAPECADDVEVMCNGVDADFFAPDPQRACPYADGEIALVFTGAMDYWPNVDAVTWFAREAYPQLRRAWPALRFHIVGRSPTAEVLALHGDGINVTGTVEDVRPYLQHAAAVVAPLRLARGIQNKVLEAMAMARPVVASQSCASAIHAALGIELLAAAEAAGFVEQVSALLLAPQQARDIGAAARQCVMRSYSWQSHLSGIEKHIAAEVVA
ncbi:MAG: TIGR03087 family PEP-CTERM/XrtA system glycosyltransferase [Rhizobacter sp.]